MLAGMAISLPAQHTPQSQMERLDRGVVALPAQSGKGNFVSWRLLGTEEDKNITFDVLRNGNKVKSGLTTTNYTDTGGPRSAEYQVVTLIDGTPTDTSKVVKTWDNIWLKVGLERPATGAQGGTYSPNDCSVGDVDGDGQYELFVKWDPSTSKDNSQDGITDNVYIDCYKVDFNGTGEIVNGKSVNGKLLWRIDLGRNIRAGAHYTQFQVYDYDGDGRAEMMCKTAPGSLDGKGNYVNQAATDDAIRAASNSKSWITSSGRMDGGQEYLTVFSGLTGEAIHTIAYNPNRNAKSGLSEAAGTFNWAVGKTDNHGYNRGDRYLAATAYLDGPDRRPSGIFCRGYYTYAFIWAVDFDGQRLHERWLSEHRAANEYSLTTYDADGNGTTQSFRGLRPTGLSSGSGTMYANGNHNMTIGDVDGDGCDEIIWGSAALDNSGRLLYGTGFGHGDAIHMGRMIPGREGMQVFQVHEEKGTYSWDLHDAATGEIIFKGGNAGVDNGRGMAAQLSAQNKEWWFSSADNREQRSALSGEVASTKSSSLNFRMYWDGTPQDQLLDGNKLDKYNDSGNSFNRSFNFYDYGPGGTCNSTKNTPCLSGDIIGDWREELILYAVTDEETYLGIYSTNIETKYAVPTLMHDHTYRMAICWQNTAYNQPPHLGYNLAEELTPHLTGAPMEMTVPVGEALTFTAKAKYTNRISIARSILPDGKQKAINVPTGWEKAIDNDAHTITITGTPDQLGEYKIAIKLTGLSGSEIVVDTLRIHAVEATGIETLRQRTATSGVTAVYDLSGHRLPDNAIGEGRRGIFIVERRTAQGIVRQKEVR